MRECKSFGPNGDGVDHVDDQVELWFDDPRFCSRRGLPAGSVVRSTVVDDQIVEQVMSADQLADYARAAGRRVLLLRLDG